MARRIRSTMPSAQVEVVPGAGHDLPMHSPDTLAERAVAFMEAEESALT